MPTGNFNDTKVFKFLKVSIIIEMKPNSKCYTTQLMNDNYKNVVWFMWFMYSRFEVNGHYYVNTGSIILGL